jgi:hypothetical protein
MYFRSAESNHAAERSAGLIQLNVAVEFPLPRVAEGSNI